MTEDVTTAIPDLEQDAAASVPDDASLAQVSELAARQVALEDEIEAAESKLKQMKADLAVVRDDRLPAAMAELGLKTISMHDGSKVEVKPFIQASIPVKHREAAFEWLRTHEFGDLVKHEVKLTFGRSEDEAASIALETLRERGFSPDDRETVHPGTLKAFIRERVEAGDEIPLDLFGAFLGQTTRISRKA